MNINEKCDLSKERKKYFIQCNGPETNRSLNLLNHKIKHTEAIISDSIKLSYWNLLLRHMAAKRNK